MPRFSLTFKALNNRQLNQGPQNQTCFFYAANVADAQTIADAIASISNGTPTSLNQQVNDYGNPLGPFGDLTVNGGTVRYRASFVSPTRRLEQINIPYLRNDISGETVEALFEDLPVLNRENEDIGQWVKGEPVQRVDGPRVQQGAVAMPPV